MFTFLLIVQAIVAAALVTVILMQRSEGGGLGVGGSSSGLMTARGAADFLTRATAILATLFVLLSIVLAGLATVETGPVEIDESLAQTPGAAPTRPQMAPAPTDDPLAGAAAAAGDATTPQPSTGAPAQGQPATNQQ
jgi:preprotein translocase subunit SecG